MSIRTLISIRGWQNNVVVVSISERGCVAGSITRIKCLKIRLIFQIIVIRYFYDDFFVFVYGFAKQRDCRGTYGII